MDSYTDRTGREIHVGDVLIYDEGAGYGRSIDEVIVHDGKLAALMRIGQPEWTVIENAEPIPLQYFKLFPEDDDNTTYHAVVVDVPQSEAFTVEYARIIFNT